ncbi:MAG: T9SS type A sorting domain-containing protein [Bacteroidota bacterium]
MKKYILEIIAFLLIQFSIISVVFAQEWKVLPIRSKIEYENNMPGGEGEQHPHSIARSLNNPDYIYLSQDVGGCWRSTDGGVTWNKTLDKGLYLPFGQSIQVDPNDPNLVFITVSYSWFQQGKSNEGLYRSTDGGDNWQLVLHTDVNYNSSMHRRHRQNITYDVTTSEPGMKTQRWYAAFPNNGLYRSDDDGNTWSDKISSLANHSIVYFVQTHPSDGKTIYVGTSSGLLKSDSLGYNLQAFGDLPSGEVSSMAVNPQNDSIIYATIRNGSLYKSTNSGENFDMVMWGTHSKIVMNPSYPNKMYLIGMNKSSFYTNNGGGIWNPFGQVTTFPGLGRETGWRRWIDGDLSGVVTNAQDENDFVAYSRSTIFKSTDGGASIGESATGWTGNAWSWWCDAAEFDRFDSNRIAFFNNDVGMKITLTSGNYFEEDTNQNAWSWYQEGKIGWVGAYSGDFQPIEGSQVIVASIGGYFVTQLMRTENNGQSWQLVTEGEDNSDYNLFIAFHPDDPNYVYAGNKISTDEGKSFSKINFPAEYYDPTIVGMCEAYPDVVFAIDRNREYLLRSKDRGLTWKEYAKPGWLFRTFDSIPIFAADPEDSNKVYTFDAKGDLASFNGNTWTNFNILEKTGGHEGINLVRAVAVDPNYSNIIYAGTIEAGVSCVFRSTDSGETWEDITNNLPRMGIGAIKVNPHTGELYRGSLNGTWIYPAPEEYYPTDIKERNNKLPNNYKLEQNYPNPFNPSTVIEYQLSEMSNVELAVYNMLGQKVKMLVNETQNAGKYQEKFNASELSSGIYFYRLRANNFVQNRKMIIVK